MFGYNLPSLRYDLMPLVCRGHLTYMTIGKGEYIVKNEGLSTNQGIAVIVNCPFVSHACGITRGKGVESGFLMAESRVIVLILWLWAGRRTQKCNSGRLLTLTVGIKLKPWISFTMNGWDKCLTSLRKGKKSGKAEAQHNDDYNW